MSHRSENKRKGLIWIISAAIAIIILIGVLIASISIISDGNRGVVYSVNGAKDGSLQPGWHFLLPTEHVVEYPVRTQTKEYDNLNVATKDGKNLKISIGLNYNINPNKVVDVYRKFGGKTDIEQIEEGYLRSRTQDALRQVISKYTVIETFGVKTAEIKKKTIEKMQNDLESKGFVIEEIAIGTPDADKATADAIDERVKATQKLERAKTDKEIAKANADKKKIEAEGEAEANRIKDKSLTDQLIKDKMIDKWKGEQPLNIGSDGVIVDLNK